MAVLAAALVQQVWRRGLILSFQISLLPILAINMFQDQKLNVVFDLNLLLDTYIWLIYSLFCILVLKQDHFSAAPSELIC